MLKYKGILFDLDGVICSTDEYHYLAWKALADRLGIPFDRERNNLLRGVSRMQSLEIVLQKADKTYTEEQKEQYRAVRRLKQEATDIEVEADDGVTIGYRLDGKYRSLKIL